MDVVVEGTEKDLPRRADEAAARGDYRQAIEHHLDNLQRLSQRDQGAMIAFRDGPYANLLLAAAGHAVDLMRRHHFIAALDLAQFITPYFESNDGLARTLADIKQRCIDRALYSRPSPRASDVVLCCAAEDDDTVQRPLAAALLDLGVMVAAEPVRVSASSREAGLVAQIAACDAVVVVLSPSFFAAAWPQNALHGLLNESAPDATQVLPIWHGISRPEVLAASEPLEKTLGFDTAKSDIALIAQGIADIVRTDLASGALHKLIWAAQLKGKTFGEALKFTEFALPTRHTSLDEDLVARIRLVRAAFLEGSRHPMASWIDAFCRELVPHSALLEWERLARTFQNLRSIQRRLGVSAHRESCLASLGAGNPGDESSEKIRQAFLEIADYPPNRLFQLVWLASQPAAKHVDFGFPSGPLGIALYLFKHGAVVSAGEDDFESQWRPREGFTKAAVVTEQADDPIHGVLQVEEERPWTKPWDVFISHASEDKAPLVRPLAEALAAHGVKVWYDSFNLRPGLSLGRSIDAGIEDAEFGIVVLSPHFITKDWPRYEFDALRARRTESGEQLIALWHDLGPDQRPAWAQGLDPERCLDAGAQPITELALQLLERVRPDLALYVQRRLAHAALQERLAQEETPRTEIDHKSVVVAPRRHERLPPTLADRVALVQATLQEVRPSSLGYWLEGFLRDIAPEPQIAFWERYAAMYLEAACIVDWQQDPSRQGVLRFFKRKLPKVAHADIDTMLDGLLNSSAPKERLAEFLQQYPEDIVNVVVNICQSDTVIEVFGLPAR